MSDQKKGTPMIPRGTGSDPPKLDAPMNGSHAFPNDLSHDPKREIGASTVTMAPENNPMEKNHHKPEQEARLTAAFAHFENEISRAVQNLVSKLQAVEVKLDKWCEYESRLSEDLQESQQRSEEKISALECEVAHLQLKVQLAKTTAKKRERVLLRNLRQTRKTPKKNKHASRRYACRTRPAAKKTHALPKEEMIVPQTLSGADSENACSPVREEKGKSCEVDEGCEVEGPPRIKNGNRFNGSNLRKTPSKRDCVDIVRGARKTLRALLRRGTARKSLKDYKLALQDLQAVLKVEANNKQALDMVNDVVTKMEKEQTQIEEELKKKRSSDCSKEQPLTNGDNNQTKKGRRLVIQEVEEEEDEEEKDGGMEQEEKGMKEEETNTAEKDKREAEPGAEKAACPGNPQLAAGEGNPPKAAGEGNTQTSGQESSGRSETDGSTASKPESAAPPPAAIPTPSPPKAAPPPLPQTVVSLKNAGNDFYAKGQYSDAHKQYSKAITRLEKEKEDHSAGLAALYSNRASCGLKSGSPRDCVADCNIALQLNPAGVKTYMKRAKAYEDMEKYGHAYVDFRSAANYDNYNTNAQNDASRMMKILKDQHGPEWRDKLPSKPKSPSFPQPVYTTPPPPTNAPLTTTTTTTAGVSPQPHPAPVPSRTQPPPQPEAKPCSDVAAQESEKKAPPQSSKTLPINTAPPTKSKKAEPANQATPPPKQATPSSKQAPPPAASKEERFQQFKAQGNDLVKKGQYSQAIGCYTRSIEVDPTQAVSYSNRALCYLKLNLPNDAIEDCNEALKRDPSSIKALYRRGQARRMVGSFPESAKDLTELLKIDPNNVAAKKELDAVKDAWRKDLREKQSKASNQTAGKGKAGGDGEGTTKTKKPSRRVQIQEVNNSSEEETESAPRHKKPAAKTSSSTTAPPGASEGQHGKAAAAPSPAAEKGGQKAKEGGKTKEAKTGKENKPASSPASGTPKAKKITAYEFMQEWTSLKKKKNVGAYAALLRQVPPNDIPKVLSNKLDGDMLSGILSAAADHLAASDPVFTFQLLNKLPSVDRFKTVKMFLSKMDKDNMQRCLNMISSLPDVCREEDLKKLKKVYGM